MNARKAVHFGAGNIGRGFIGEVLFRNGFHIDFVDISDTVIDALHSRGGYEIEFAGKTRETLAVSNVDGINSKTDSGKVVEAIVQADLVTTAIGPNVLPFIAELIARGLEARGKQRPDAPLDVIACENMIGGSEFLAAEVQKHLSDGSRGYVRDFVGFPNAAVDRIVPAQHHDDPLAVSVEPYKEWIIAENGRKALAVKLDGVSYADDLEPYIERKLFSVNTGHATVAFSGARAGYKTIDEAISDAVILDRLRRVLRETGSLVVAKWGFDGEAHNAYIEKIIGRFENPNNPDTCARVARQPIRKLGKDERFIRPIRELKERSMPYPALLETAALVLAHDDPEDAESVKLRSMLNGRNANEARQVIADITGLSDGSLVDQITGAYVKL
ncbi:MAG: mannitol-1-phosphate 5-dehydrogenase [Spirochaetaceae bacterium]|jgi:mannitol-1-phosphate 5-dehydrogenase|nr:mannitol-1-phosphate 5-dehydrogenase [Spirochaetaceae bacterium]